MEYQTIYDFGRTTWVGASWLLLIFGVVIGFYRYAWTSLCMQRQQEPGRSWIHVMIGILGGSTALYLFIMLVQTCVAMYVTTRQIYVSEQYQVVEGAVEAVNDSRTERTVTIHDALFRHDQYVLMFPRFNVVLMDRRIRQGQHVRIGYFNSAGYVPFPIDNSTTGNLILTLALPSQEISRPDRVLSSLIYWGARLGECGLLLLGVVGIFPFVGGFLIGNSRAWQNVFGKRFWPLTGIKQGHLSRLALYWGDFIGIVSATTWGMTRLLSVVKFRTTICSGCLQYSSPSKATYEDGIRYCEHCQHAFEHRKNPRRLAFAFGKHNISHPHDVLLVMNPSFRVLHHAVDVSRVYIDPVTCDFHAVERFLTYIINHPPEAGLHSVKIIHRGKLEELDNNLVNALRNTFVHFESADNGKNDEI